MPTRRSIIISFALAAGIAAGVIGVTLYKTPPPPPTTPTAPTAPTAPDALFSVPPGAVYVPVDQAKFYTGTLSECWFNPSNNKSMVSRDDRLIERIPPNAGSPVRPLYFTIVVHVEPFEGYKDGPMYERDRDRLVCFSDLVGQHGGKVTLEIQPPMTEHAALIGDDFLAAIEGHGHEVAMHFHEDNYLPPGATLQQWIAAMSGVRSGINALITHPVATWSGGNNYAQLPQAGQGAGMTFDNCFKTRDTQMTPAGYYVDAVWRPMAMTPPNAFKHDPRSPMIYMPGGVQPAHCEKANTVPIPYTYSAFDYMTIGLRASLISTAPGRINSGYYTLHPNNFFQQSSEDLIIDFPQPTEDQEFGHWDQWLTTIVDPLVADGRLVWSTTGQTGLAFMEWE
jgi:hypothetical protein